MMATPEQRGTARADVTVGVDLVDVGRLARLAAEPGALAGVLTERERSYCTSRRRPAEHIAARFAAKEAVLKAFGTGLVRGLRWTDVEVLKERGGRPRVLLHGRLAELAAARGLLQIDISLSHTAHLAIAQAVVLWGPDLEAPCLSARTSAPSTTSRPTAGAAVRSACC